MNVRFGDILRLQYQGKPVTHHDAGVRAQEGFNALLQLQAGEPRHRQMVGLQTLREGGQITEFRLLTGEHYDRYLRGQHEALAREKAKPLEMTQIFGKRLLKKLVGKDS